MIVHYLIILQVYDEKNLLAKMLSPLQYHFSLFLFIHQLLLSITNQMHCQMKDISLIFYEYFGNLKELHITVWYEEHTSIFPFSIYIDKLNITPKLICRIELLGK